jgi:hypothetical protein
MRHAGGMRWTLITFVVLAVGVGASTAGGTAQKASLRITDRDPLTLRGEGFQSRERVSIALSAPVQRRKMTRASATGSLRVTFLEISATRCDSVRAVAVGGAGSRATLKLLPAPACSPMQTP